MLALLSATTNEATADPIRGTPATTDNKPLVFHQARARALIRQAYDTQRWRDPTPAKPAEKRAWKRHRLAILIPKTRFAISFYRERMAGRFERYRAKQLAAESDCISGVTVYSLGGQCLSIPGYIVSCESQGSWSAYNPSGAASIYQIMPEHGRPWPVASVEDKRAHHRIAAQLYAGGSGASNWVCA